MEQGDAASELWQSIESLDIDAAKLAMAKVLDENSMARALSDVFVPLLQRIGDQWEDGSLAVAHEQFASQLLRRTLSALDDAQGPSVEAGRHGPQAVLACPPGERHDLVLLCFSLLLGEQGWRTQFLGGDTPVAVLAATARAVDADAVVLAATRSTALTAHSTSLRQLARRHPVFIAGGGADDEVASLIGARLLPPDPVVALAHLRASSDENIQRQPD